MNKCPSCKKKHDGELKTCPECRARQKAWGERNKEYVQQRTKNWYQANKESVLKQCRTYRENNLESRRQYSRDWYQANRDRALRASRIRRLNSYGLSPEEYERLVQLQNGECAICGDKPEKLFVDHHHEKGFVRDLLCRDCNSTIGFVKESPERAMCIASYIKHHNANEGKVRFSR